MGNLLTVIVNAVLEEITKKVRSLGYHSYKVDYDTSFTIDGIRNNPKCKLTVKKTTISAEDLFVLEDVSKDANNKLSVCIKVPQILLNIGKAGFACRDPKLSIAVKGWIKFTDIYLTLTVSVNMTNNGLQLDYISVKPKITEVKSDIQLVVNDKQCSELANSMLCSQDPTLLNFVLEFILKTQEESVMKFINTHMQEAQKSPTFD